MLEDPLLVEETSISDIWESCSWTPLDDPQGRQRIGVDQPEGGSDYPFVRPSDDIRDLLGDLSLRYRDGHCPFRRPFHVRWLYGFGCQSALVPHTMSHLQDICIVDADENVVFDSRDAEFESTAWGGRMQICRWMLPDSVLAVTVFLAWGSEDTPQDWPIYFEPQRAVLDERTVITEPRQLRSLAVEGLPATESGRIVLDDGYNSTWAVQDLTSASSTRLTTGVTLNVVPDSGLGRYAPHCGETELAIRRVSGIAGDSHANFFIDGSDCYRVERPLVDYLDDPTDRRAVVRAAALKISDDCGPCCDCQDYINTYEAIRRLYEQVRELVLTFLTLRDNYVANVTSYARLQQCVEHEHSLGISLTTICPASVAVTAAICNKTGACLTDIAFVMQFVGVDPVTGLFVPTDTPEIGCFSTFRGGDISDLTEVSDRRHSGRNLGLPRYYNLIGEYPKLIAFFDVINPNSLGFIMFRLDFPAPVQVRGTVDAYQSAAHFAGPAWDTTLA